MHKKMISFVIVALATVAFVVGSSADDSRRLTSPDLKWEVPPTLVGFPGGDDEGDDEGSDCPVSFPATGQTTTYAMGDDGDIQAGAALSYTDNLDGTITDNNTGLMWEKKDAAGGINDKDAIYNWVDALGFIDTLNGNMFAGHDDWRLPNVKELHSIVNYENADFAVSAEFDTNCVAACTVLACSCTGSSFYWSSTSFVLSPLGAWSVNFTVGLPALDSKDDALRVRAVRGGL